VIKKVSVFFRLHLVNKQSSYEALLVLFHRILVLIVASGYKS